MGRTVEQDLCLFSHQIVRDEGVSISLCLSTGPTTASDSGQKTALPQFINIYFDRLHLDFTDRIYRGRYLLWV